MAEIIVISLASQNPSFRKMAALGVFDSGYGGLTVFRSLAELLPEFDYIYLGDNARAPYGPLSFETVYDYTLEAVKWFSKMGCPLVVIACNTASAKALRTIQQRDLHGIDPKMRVLGIIRPTAEVIGNYSTTGKIGILGTKGTIGSNSYLIEIGHFFPQIEVFQQACPLWVSFIERGVCNDDRLEAAIEADLGSLFQKNSSIDTVLLACTHYPLVADIIYKYLPQGVRLISQGEIVAKSLKTYLCKHGEIADRLSQSGKRLFFTTGEVPDFEGHATLFFGNNLQANFVEFSP